MKRFIYIASISGVFALGFLSGRFLSPSTNNASSAVAAISSLTAFPQQASDIVQFASATTMRQNAVSASQGYDYVKTQLHQTSDQQLNSYLDKLLGSDGTQHIQNKREFAQRAAEEFFNQRPPLNAATLQGNIKIGLSPDIPQWSERNLQLQDRQKVFAHLQVNDKVPKSQNLFVKWEDLTNGELLLFEKKNVDSLSSTNWVSTIPASGWQPHTYRVTFYSFDSKLNVLAEQSYQVNQVQRQN